MLLVVEVLGQQRGEVGLSRDFYAIRFPVVLVKYGRSGVLEDDVVQGITGVDLLLDFGIEVIAAVFGFPIGEGALVSVDQGAVDPYMLARITRLPGVFFYEAEFTQPAQAGKQGAKDAARSTFMRNFLLIAQFFQGFVVLVEQAVVGTDGDRRHQVCFRWADVMRVF